ncbi:MAG TPA: acyltransferase [Acidimicrobiales bacterium]|nr:acyltransferase [Acidimicrobiales bacterium]
MGRADDVRAWARGRKADLIHRSTDRIRAAAAIGPDCARGRRFRAFGEASCIAYPWATIFGEAHIEIGTGTMIGSFNTLSAGFAPGHDFGDRCVISIGDRVVLGRGSHIVGHDRIVVEDDVYTGPYVYITDQNHTYRDPELPIGRQWPTDDPVRIGAGSWLGTNVVVLPGADIGRNVVVAAGSIVRGEVPDHSVIAGSPAKIIRRFDPDLGWQPPLRSSSDDESTDLAELAGLAEALGVRPDPRGRF